MFLGKSVLRSDLGNVTFYPLFSVHVRIAKFTAEKLTFSNLNFPNSNYLTSLLHFVFHVITNVHHFPIQ